MDAELRRVERAGIRTSNAAALTLRAAVLRAWLRGGDPAAAVAAFERSMAATLADAMAAGYLQGRLRARATARQARRGVSLSLADMMDDFGDRLGLGASEIQLLAEYFATQATSRVVDAGSLIRSKIADAAAEAIRRGDSVRSGAALIREAMDASGVTPQNPYLAETLYRTSLQESYAAARYQANQAPEVDEILWGYEYVAIADDRTTDLCLKLDGTKRPKADPFWQQYTPPNHWGCRSTVIEVFTDDPEASSTRVPSIEAPQDGFAVNFGEVFRVPERVLVPA